jgi:hypothetical protein
MRIGRPVGNCTAGVDINRSWRQYSEIEILSNLMFRTEYLRDQKEKALRTSEIHEA